MHTFLALFGARHRKGSSSDPPLRVSEAIIDRLHHIVFILLMKHQKAPSIKQNPSFPFLPSHPQIALIYIFQYDGSMHISKVY